MKKLFIAAMALATIVSCSKDDNTTVLESSKKSVAITIKNGVSATRADLPVPEQTPVPVGGDAKILPQETEHTAAIVDDLTILFANNAGKVVEIRTFDDASEITAANATADPDVQGVYTYRYHNVHESVTQVAVVRHDEPTGGFVGTSLTNYAADAAVENRQVAVDELDLYGSAKIIDSGTTCKVKDVAANGHVTEYEYKLYTANVEVIPTLARVEIIGISCTDLGETTLASVSDSSITGGFDEMILKDIYFGASDKKYTYTFLANDILKGVYAGEGNTTKRALTPYVPAGNKTAIAWNIAPSVPFFSAGNPMVLTLDASAYDYDVISNVKTLRIVGDKNGVDKFERSKIYRMQIDFKESNLDATNDEICVDVKVTIANWVIIEVDPSFGSGN